MKKLLSFAVIAAMSVGAYAGVCGEDVAGNCATVFKAKFSVKTTASGKTKAVKCNECEEEDGVCYRKQGSRTYEGLLYSCDCTCDFTSLQQIEKQIFWSKKGLNLFTMIPAETRTTYYVTLPDGKKKEVKDGSYSATSIATNQISDTDYTWVDPWSGATRNYAGTPVAPKAVNTNEITIGTDGKPVTNNAVWDVFGPDGKLYQRYYGAVAPTLAAPALVAPVPGYIVILPDNTPVTAKTPFELKAEKVVEKIKDEYPDTLPDVHELTDAELVFDFIHRIDKGGKKVEAVGKLTLWDDCEFTLAGFGTYDTKRDIIKKISGYFAGTDLSTACGCDGEPAGYWGFCENAGYSIDEPKTAAYGSWSITYDKSMSKKIAARENGAMGGDLKLPSYIEDATGL